MPSLKASVHLFIPHLLQHLILWDKDFLFQAEAPHFSQLLRQYSLRVDSSRTGPDQIGLSNSLFAQVPAYNQSELPMAYYRYLAQCERISESPLLCADPVHLEAGLNDIILTQTISDLSDDDVQQLMSLLNQHFEQDNLFFFSASNQQWYLRLPEYEVISSVPLENALQQNIVKTKSLSGSRNWQVIQNEIQMLLHGSEVNQRRESAGLPTVNSVWLWGGGKPLQEKQLVQKTQATLKQVIGGDTIGMAVAKALECDWQALAGNRNDELIEDVIDDNCFIIFDQLAQPAMNNQHNEFQAALSKIDQTIIKPLLQQWQNNKIDLVINTCDGCQIHPQRVPVWKLWQKPPSLLDVAQKGEKVGGCT